MNTQVTTVPKLSKREDDVFRWYLHGKTTGETAEILSISQASVRTYFDRMKVKFQCKYKYQLILKMIEHGVISVADWTNPRSD